MIDPRGAIASQRHEAVHARDTLTRRVITSVLAVPRLQLSSLSSTGSQSEESTALEELQTASFPLANTGYTGTRRFEVAGNRSEQREKWMEDLSRVRQRYKSLKRRCMIDRARRMFSFVRLYPFVPRFAVVWR